MNDARQIYKTLNPSEYIVLRAIEYCSRGEMAKGWYGTMQALADYLPCKVDRKTVRRAIDKLVNMGLVHEVDGAIYACGQNDRDNGQNDHMNGQNDRENGQNALPPVPPYIKEINKERNEREKDTRRAQTRTYAKPPPQPYDEGFLSILAAFRLLDSESQNRTEDQKQRDEQRAWKAWQMHPELHQAATEVVKFGLTKKDDLAFTIEDAMQLQPQIPVPVDYRGQPLGRGIRYYMATYKGERGLYTADDVRRYRMTKPEYFDVP